MPILVAVNLSKNYWGGQEPIRAVRAVSLEVQAGEFLAIMGPSGCGKSTLLHLFGGMDRASDGQMEFEGQSMAAMKDDQLTSLRRKRIGFVFQFFNLLPSLTAIENVALPLRLAGMDSNLAEGKAGSWLERVGMAPRRNHYPHQLSGGEMQRVAIARAAVHSPSLILADEPTGNLDSSSGASILRLLSDLNQKTGITMILATHSLEVASLSDRVIYIRDGSVEKIEQRTDRLCKSHVPEMR
jgi:putative ABC transport system ATP-binding protein